jgi:hypothetical protein
MNVPGLLRKAALRGFGILGKVSGELPGATG